MVTYIKREIKRSSVDSKNNCNIFNLAPFRYHEGVLYISDKEMERVKGTLTWEIITNRVGLENIQVVNTDKLLDYPNLTPDHEIYQIMYQANWAMSNAKSWYKLLPDANFFELSDEQCDLLLEYKFQSMLDSLNNCMKSVKAPYFVKTGACSTKRDMPPIPVYNAEEALRHLLSSENVKRSLKNRQAGCILIQPWTTDINPSCEFRIFVRNGVVTGVSQQFLYDVHPVMNYWSAEDIVQAFQSLWDTFDEELKPKDAVFDGYITTDSEGEIAAHLIEINTSAMGWGPAGSGLFCWIDDPPPYVDSPREFRVTVS